MTDGGFGIRFRFHLLSALMAMVAAAIVLGVNCPYCRNATPSEEKSWSKFHDGEYIGWKVCSQGWPFQFRMWEQARHVDPMSESITVSYIATGINIQIFRNLRWHVYPYQLTADIIIGVLIVILAAGCGEVILRRSKQSAKAKWSS